MDGLYGSAERRRYKRVDVSFIATYKVLDPIKARNKLEENYVYTKMFNLSEGGMAISAVYNVPNSSLLSLRFTLIDSLAYRSENRFKPMSMTAEVVYSVKSGALEYRWGICFKNINEEDRRSIADFAARR